MYSRFGLVLMVNHACSLRCTYCYTGRKFDRAMPVSTGTRAIDRALASLARGGTLELGFFGGEPLVEADLIASLLSHARLRARGTASSVDASLTTNGVQAGGAAWTLMTDPDLDLAISYDGMPRAHDRHRVFADGRGSAAIVLATLTRLLEAGKDFRVIMVVRPTTVDALAEGIAFSRDLGVRRVDLSLDLWTPWSREDGARLEAALARAAVLWRDSLPGLAVNWFDEKAAQLAGVPMLDSARCGFGRGEVAVAPSGRLYPCERLIGEDVETNPMRLKGDVFGADDFLRIERAAARSSDACSACAIQSICSTTCRCSNYVRTGRVDEPDGLLCLLDQACFRETARALGALEDRMSDPRAKESNDGSSEART
jgi:uncharacterized protein